MNGASAPSGAKPATDKTNLHDLLPGLWKRSQGKLRTRRDEQFNYQGFGREVKANSERDATNSSTTKGSERALGSTNPGNR
jgi:hypothetical protein